MEKKYRLNLKLNEEANRILERLARKLGVSRGEVIQKAHQPLR